MPLRRGRFSCLKAPSKPLPESPGPAAHSGGRDGTRKICSQNPQGARQAELPVALDGATGTGMPSGAKVRVSPQDPTRSWESGAEADRTGGFLPGRSADRPSTPPTLWTLRRMACSPSPRYTASQAEGPMGNETPKNRHQAKRAATAHSCRPRTASGLHKPNARAARARARRRRA